MPETAKNVPLVTCIFVHKTKDLREKLRHFSRLVLTGSIFAYPLRHLDLQMPLIPG